MAYTVINFKSGKAVKEAFKGGVHIEVFQPGPFGPSVNDGRISLQGPHHPAPHTWYLNVDVKDGIVVKVHR